MRVSLSVIIEMYLIYVQLLYKNKQMQYAFKNVWKTNIKKIYIYLINNIVSVKSNFRLSKQIFYFAYKIF